MQEKKKISEGKTKIIWELGEGTVEIESKPDITAGDGARRDIIRGKEVLANNTTCNVFELLSRKRIRTHFLKRRSKNSFSAIRYEMIPLEVVIRSIATGSYLKRNPDVSDGTVFGTLVVEFFYKDDILHDPYIVIEEGKWNLYNPKEPVSERSYITSIDSLCSTQEVEYIRKTAEKVFLVLEKAFKKLGIVLWDLKIEFGKTLYGEIVVADVIDNDSWRIKTIEGEQLDKQLYRDGKDLKTVKNKYEIVSELTDKFRDF